MKTKEVALELEHPKISDIPAASLWELCRSYDAEAGAALGGKYVGLQIYAHFERQTGTVETMETANERYWKEVRRR